MSARLHAIVNLAMNFLLWLGVWVSIFLNYFAFRVIFTQDYQVGLKTLTHLMKYEDVLGEVYTSFYNFQEFACNSSHDDGILTVCSNLTNFTVAGIIYLLIAYVLIITLILTQANLLMLVL